MFGVATINILLLEGESVALMQWRGNALRLHFRYRPIDPHFDAFQLFLEENRKVPFIVVADFIEEDFRNESVAHVTGSDRSSLLNRKLHHAFRTTQYRTARVVGRELEGRKDDKILLTALTKPELLDPWIERILKKNIPIQAVTSAAYLMELFIQTLKIKSEEHLLLVNREAGSGLRQTYLQKGRVIFSRLTPASVTNHDTFHEFLFEQCEQTRKYLERIKQLPYDATLKIHVYTPDSEENSADEQRDLLDFHFISIDELPVNYQIDLGEAMPGAVAHSLVTAFKKKGVPNVYAPFQTLRYFYIRKAARALYAASLLAFASAIAIAGPSLADANSRWDRERSLIAQTQPLLAEYESLRQRFPETPIPSSQMELVVETHDNLLAQVYYPRAMLEVISQALLVSPRLEITRVDWSLEPPANNEEMAPVFGGLLAETRAASLRAALIAGNSVLVTTVRGIVESETGPRDERRQVLAFSTALGAMEGLSVTPITMPLEVRSDTAISTTLDGSARSQAFVLEIRKSMQP
ncbi:MAG: hypothetical protein Q8L60_14845 [Gammaproteobacteria bacterium]|nr:hypothetical protein [Gammaproteobacteria bacterium]MDP2349470.1 hypothetical protein [Gammaproteobacteria bacterium]